uniref:tricyclene synthase n=1 Tax=Scoparia dulcis TaxID=107240 RepID=F6M9X0_SCODU|nr:ent-kaurene synthase [Scoparia dulcis]
MSLQLSIPLFFRQKKLHFKNSCFSGEASFDTGIETVVSAENASHFEETKERIAKLLHKAELSISSYDTAWVAMVPSPHSSQEPCFPDCLNWLMENQCPDGSWARPHHHSLLGKDVLSSTLASVLALQRWGVGEEQISRGVRFIEQNFVSAMEKSQISPLGFGILFPGMLEYAKDISLDIHFEPRILHALMHEREMEIKRCNQIQSADTEAYLAYVAEGMGKLQNWESVLKYQRKNGSLFNSPSTTAAASMYLRNPGCLNYLRSALKKFGNAVSAIYPFDIYAKLCSVDNLLRMGIGQYFRTEIQCVLDETYSLWLQDDEGIFMDACTCALAFRILRMNGYDVTSDQISKVLEEGWHPSSFRGHVKDISMGIELYKPSELIVSPDESILEKQHLELKHLIEKEILKGPVYSSHLVRNVDQEANHVLQYPFYTLMERMANRRNIEHYNLDYTRVLKTSYSSPNFGNRDFLTLSVADFNNCQELHREELKEIERWVVENRLDELKFARQKSAYCYFSAAATIFSPELSDARMSWAKNGVLTTVVDDFFDGGGSMEELRNLVHLVERWDIDVSTGCSSQNVLMIYSALRRTICEIGDQAFLRQERNVTQHIIDIWLDLLNSMLKEAEWSGEKPMPTMDEYMSNAYVSFALGPIVLPPLYLVGPKLSEEMITHAEYHNLFRLMSTVGRLLNDIRTSERERKDGTPNALTLYISGGKMTKEAAIAEMKSLIESQRRELLRLVLDRKNSVLPKACKDLFWHMNTVLHVFYSKDDGFTSQEMIRVVNEIIYQPIVLDEP